MGTLELIIFAAALLYIGSIIYMANWQDATGQQGRGLRWMLFIVVGLVLYSSLNVVAAALMPDSMRVTLDEALPPVSVTSALVSFIFTLIVSLVSTAIIVSPAARATLRRILSSHATYNPDSSVHTTAVVLSLAMISFLTNQFVLSGGLAGLAEMVEASGISSGEVVFNGILWVIVALLGVGFAVRRSGSDTLSRLGLRAPTLQDVTVGIGVGSVLYIFQITALAIWILLVSPETLTEQTVAVEQISLAINSLPLALLISLSAGIGEEIFFRGAVQPVFGIIPTSLLFMAVHTQYTLTPAALVLFLVTLGFGWLRYRYSTVAAIIAHFFYNFIPLSLAVLGGSIAGG